MPELGSYSGNGNGNPLLYSCLENSVDREAWQATVQLTHIIVSFYTLENRPQRSHVKYPKSQVHIGASI